MTTADDTIVAIASPLSPARRGIVRLSGPDVVSILAKGLRTNLSPRQSAHRFASAIDTGSPLGWIEVDVLLWPTGRSYTGQPSAELHLVGSLPLLDAVVESLVESGSRPAKPGEFTMRAFLAGRLDLTQAEAVLGVIDAEDPSTLNQALSQLAGNLSRPLQQARDVLLNLLADVEAGLDFVDEDIEFIEDSALIERLTELLVILQLALVQLRQRGVQSSSTAVVLRGLPNAGKSCLLNALSQTDSAIVTSEAGTTRDIITIDVDHQGHRFSITDTAGIEMRHEGDADFEVMTQAQKQATEAVRRADVCVWCFDATESHPSLAPEQVSKEKTERRKASTDLFVLTKMDLVGSHPAWASQDQYISISSQSGFGLDQLWNALIAAADLHDTNEVGGVIGTAARCRESLTQAIQCIETAITATRDQAGHELVAAEIRSAVEQLGEVTGAVYTDDILDRVFSRFCIGK